mmetsp:Transcript_8424/g.10653  ORF Transcript_8424/g.10653 Transcript_8424/m.10653 type:complete len:875 (+) Transcript_8424:213-2837(+)
MSSTSTSGSTAGLPPPPSFSAMTPTSSSSFNCNNNNFTSPTTANPSSSSTSTSTNILSAKVQRALQVRTDTPAMITALSSLAALHENNIDARNVRNAIEEDALYQARLLEKELNNLVDIVKTMRSSIKDVVSVAESVGHSLETGLVTGTNVYVNGNVNGNMNGNETSSEERKNVTGANGHVSFEEERQLAALLADAFQERDNATKRYESISAFLEKYDLSENDSQLLEQYNFDDIFNNFDREAYEYRNENESSSASSAAAATSNNDGMAFLEALESVTRVRKELASSFGDGTDTGNESKSNNHHGATTSAIRMIETLASKQERAFERLYHFLHAHLDLQQASVAHVPTSSSGGAGASLSSVSYKNRQNRLLSEDEDGMDETLSHPFVRKALIVLKQVPAYYSHTLELIATSRRSEVTRKFLLALTSGYNGMAPIEMKAHDPVNYVGDMLAFLFRTVSVESELAKGLAMQDPNHNRRKDHGNDNGGEDHDEDDVKYQDGQQDNDDFGTIFMSPLDVLNDTLSGVARPLKSRISQVIASLARRPDDDLHDHGMMDEEADTARMRLTSLYSICGLLLFYHSAIMKAINKLDTKKEEDASLLALENNYNDSSGSGSVNPLVQSFLECLEESARAYVASLKVYCATLDHLASFSNETHANLTHSAILRICDVRAASPGFGPGMNMEIALVSQVASEALSLEYLCETMMDAVIPSCSNIDDVVTMKSALQSMKKAGLSFDCASKWNNVIYEKEKNMIDAQIASDTNYVLDECGLGSIASALESMKAVYIEGMVISSHPGLSQQSLQLAMKKFYESLYDPPYPSYENIKDPVLRKRARNKIAENVVEVYREIYEMVTSEQGGYGDMTFLGHSPEQVKALLS